jgi:hypothetical protein
VISGTGRPWRHGRRTSPRRWPFPRPRAPASADRQTHQAAIPGARRITPREDVIPITDEDRILEVLDEDECRRLLEKTSIGRLAFTDGALPAILPVCYAVHDGHVLVAARRGSPVTKALRGAVVAFEIDAWSGEDRTGWSATVVGPSRVISTPDEVQRLEDLQLTNRPPAVDRCYIAVRIDLLRGWRMTPSTDQDAASPLDPTDL